MTGEEVLEMYYSQSGMDNFITLEELIDEAIALSIANYIKNSVIFRNQALAKLNEEVS